MWYFSCHLLFTEMCDLVSNMFYVNKLVKAHWHDWNNAYLCTVHTDLFNHKGSAQSTVLQAPCWRRKPSHAPSSSHDFGGGSHILVDLAQNQPFSIPLRVSSIQGQRYPIHQASTHQPVAIRRELDKSHWPTWSPAPAWKNIAILIWVTLKLLYFAWSPPWHLYIFLLANILAFYLTYLLAFYLAYLLAYVLAYLLAFYLANLLAFYLAYLLAFYLTLYLAYLQTFFLAFYLAYLLTFYLTYLLTFFPAYLLTFFLTFFLAFYLAYLLTFYLTSYLTSFLTFFPLKLRSGSAHCDLEVAVEVRQCPLGSGLRGGGGGWGGGGGGGEELC